MKTILVKAYAHMNLGDDLFIKMLCERYKETKFYLFATERYTKVDGFRLDNLTIEYNNSLYKKILTRIGRAFNIPNILEDRCAKSVDGVVNIGGSIFIENDFSQEDLNVRVRNLENGKNYFILGSNFGPYKTESFKETYNKFFKECRDVCFRDTKSYELFKELENVRVGQDIVFSLDEEKIEPSETKGYNLISVILPSRRKGLERSEGEYFQRLKDIVIESVKAGERVKLISFCEDEGDELAIDKLLSMIPNEYGRNISKYFYKGDINEALRVIKGAKRVIATRFHAMILGFVFKKPVFPICYNEKMENVLKDLDFKGNYVYIDKVSKLTYDRVIENESLDEKTLLEAASGGEKQFQGLDEFLEN